VCVGAINSLQCKRIYSATATANEVGGWAVTFNIARRGVGGAAMKKTEKFIVNADKTLKNLRVAVFNSTKLSHYYP